MNIHTSETEYLKSQVQRLSALVRAQQITIDKLEAQPEQEPVATLWQHGETGRTRITMPNDITDCDARWFKAADLYTTPPQRKPLTDEEIEDIWADCPADWDDKINVLTLARAIEAAHGIKGEA